MWLVRLLPGLRSLNPMSFPWNNREVTLMSDSHPLKGLAQPFSQGAAKATEGDVVVMTSDLSYPESWLLCCTSQSWQVSICQLGPNPGLGSSPAAMLPGLLLGSPIASLLSVSVPALQPHLQPPE